NSIRRRPPLLLSALIFAKSLFFPLGCDLILTLDFFLSCSLFGDSFKHEYALLVCDSNISGSVSCDIFSDDVETYAGIIVNFMRNKVRGFTGFYFKPIQDSRFTAAWVIVRIIMCEKA